MQYNLKYKIEDDYINSLLINRGIKREDLNDFLHPTKKNYICPKLLDNMNEGVELINKHLNKNYPIDLIIDCDVDGFTSAAEIYLFWKLLEPEREIRYHLHTGKQHGLGDMIDILLEKNDCFFVICPDSSSNDYEQHKMLKGAGIDILILDHHEVDNGYSPYAVTINNQLSENYSNKALSGATVVYKFINYYANIMKLNNEVKTKIYNLIDLAAVGAIGDMMSVMTLENRYLFNEGLHHINNYGLYCLIEKQSYSLGNIEDLTPIGIAFYIVPLMNALIRVGSMGEKEILFLALVKGKELIQSTKRGSKKGQLEFIGEQNARNCINAKNRQKREEDKAVDYFNMIIERDNLNENKVLIIENDKTDLNSNLTGLVAMKIMNEYNKPVLLVKEGLDNTLKGSGRADSKSALKDFRNFLTESTLCEYAQGHASAFGCGFKVSNKEKLIEYCNEKLKDIDFNEGVYSADFILGDDINKNTELIKDIYFNHSIFGQGCDEPLLVTEDISLTKNDIFIMGKTADTIKFTYKGIEYIQFRAKKLIKDIQNLDTFTITVIGRAGLNTFMGQEKPQITIIDYNIRDNILEF